MDRAIDIKKRAYAASHPSLLDSIRAQGDAAPALGRLAEARGRPRRGARSGGEGGRRPVEDAEELELSADVLVAARRSRDAIPLYKQALALVEAQYGNERAQARRARSSASAPPSSTPATSRRRLATAERAVAIETYGSAPIDVRGAAQFLLARRRWAQGDDRAGALALARATRRQARRPALSGRS